MLIAVKFLCVSLFVCGSVKGFETYRERKREVVKKRSN